MRRRSGRPLNGRRGTARMTGRVTGSAAMRRAASDAGLTGRERARFLAEGGLSDS